MDVSTAVVERRSVRQFTDRPVADDVLRDLVTRAAQSPSGGNVQPWRIYVVNGESMTRFRAFLGTRPKADPIEYDIYPSPLGEPYRTNRFVCGEMMYATLGIAREDRPARLAQFARNGDAFGAPALVLCYLDRQMGPPQWSDLGMYLQTFMLLATEAGLATCAQEYWSVRNRAVSDFVGAPDNEMLFCGVAVGHEDTAAPINALRTERMAFDDFARMV